MANDVILRSVRDTLTHFLPCWALPGMRMRALCPLQSDFPENFSKRAQSISPPHTTAVSNMVPAVIPPMRDVATQCFFLKDF